MKLSPIFFKYSLKIMLFCCTVSCCTGRVLFLLLSFIKVECEWKTWHFRGNWTKVGKMTNKKNKTNNYNGIDILYVCRNIECCCVQFWCSSCTKTCATICKDIPFHSGSFDRRSSVCECECECANDNIAVLWVDFQQIVRRRRKCNNLLLRLHVREFRKSILIGGKKNA